MKSRGVLRVTSGGKFIAVWCPACKHAHVFDVTLPQGWTFNGDYEKPTFTPSMILRGGHYSPTYDKSKRCWCDYNREHVDDPHKFICSICHFNVTDGKIIFHPDCTHEYAGRTLELEAFHE